MPDLLLLKELINSARAAGSRSSALTPLHWVLVIEMTALVAMYGKEGPGWVLPCLGVAIGLTLLVYLGTFVFFARRKPDLLRSETFNLQKMAVERGLVGDSRTGLSEGDEDGPRLPVQAGGERG